MKITYCFRCPKCGYRVETPVRDPAPTCNHDGHEVYTMIRDYRAEDASFDKRALRGGVNLERRPVGR